MNTVGRPTSGGTLPIPISTGVFVGSSILNLGVGVGIRYADPDLSPRWYPAITLATSTAIFSALQKFRLIQNYTPLAAVRTMPMIYGIQISSSLLLDATLGYVPHLETFQSGGMANQLISSTLGFAGPFILLALGKIPAAMIFELGVFALVNQGLGLVDSWIDLAKTTDVTIHWDLLHQPAKFSLTVQRESGEIASAKMEELVWEAELREAADSKLPRPIASFANDHLGFFVKGGAKFTEWISSKSDQNREARRARMRALVISDFSALTRSTIAQAIVESISENKIDKTAQIDWLWASIKIQNSYHSNPNIKLFYRYGYPRYLIDARYFPEGKNPIQQIEQLKRLVDEEGKLDLRGSDDAQKEVKQKQFELIHLALAVLEEKKQEYAEKYPKEEPSDKTAHPNFVVALGPLTQEEQENYPDRIIRKEFARYNKIRTQLETLKKIKQSLEKELH